MPYDPSRHGPRRIVGPGFHEQVHELVRRIPAGAVASYGDVARALGSVGVARHVGWALAALPAGDAEPGDPSHSSDPSHPSDPVPWWRVVDSTGRLARPGTAAARRQARLLANEGVAVSKGRVVGFALLRAAEL
ncbi:MAG: MGMT family protein [Planctomycetes bacterium]|nr:MGMT family protein [Planctomycetota bacterium]